MLSVVIQLMEIYHDLFCLNFSLAIKYYRDIKKIFKNSQVFKNILIRYFSETARNPSCSLIKNHPATDIMGGNTV